MNHGLIPAVAKLLGKTEVSALEALAYFQKIILN